MKQTIIEYLREQAVGKLFETSGFQEAWPIWVDVIHRLAPVPTEHQLYNLGDSLKTIFNSTNTSDSRSQSDVAGGGANWEALVCWYLNLCLIGRRTVVIKHHKSLIPSPVSKAITVNYGTFPSNTESDLIAITFPDKIDYTKDKKDIRVKDINYQYVQTCKIRTGTYNLLPVLDALCARDFDELEIHIIQCKTNWNDNAQIPMLWDAVYNATTFRNGITLGTDGFSINDVGRFTYSFVTVPTVKLEKIKENSVAVLRVRNLSGGNYWGLPSQRGIASSVKELLERNLKSGENTSIVTSIKNNLEKLPTIYNYFGL